MTKFELVNAASGDVNLIYNGIPLHCNNNPQQEAMTEFQKIKNLTSKNIVIIIGLGLGYLLKRVFISSKCRIIVHESNENISEFTLKAVDFKEELQSGRVFITNTIDELSSTLAKVYGFNDNVNVLKLKSSDLLYPDLIKNLNFELPAIVATLQSNFTTLSKMSWPWLRNSLYKLRTDKPDYALSILEGKFKDKAALIISAGPSLDKNIDIIKQNREKFIIFCVNVAYKKLMLAGIIPDFTFYIDAGNFLYTINNYDHSNTNIITHPVAYMRILEELNPNKFFTFYCKNDLLSRWVAKFSDFSLENYETKGSVSHLALLTACNMGCNPIILTGQDLAYTDGKYYSSGSFWSEGCENNERFEKKLKKLQETGSIKVKGQNGEILLSSPDYAGFINHFEEFARGHKIKLINCSTGGAQINGFENRDLSEIASELNTLNMNINEFLDNIIQTETDPVKANYSKIQDQLKLFANDVQKAYSVTEKGLQNIRNLEQELRKPYINSAKVGQLANKSLILFNELENDLFKKWNFSLLLAYKELMEFYAIMDDEANKDNNTLIFELAKTLRPLFEVAGERLKRLNRGLLPKILGQII
ncbi:MAG: hypothetical protein A2Y25_01550 [Candidatus Melainabacteria bacterium GWF2_37_15]|nr:MAG: hypothetical protein A2Y25_01550 [Candidatus Melainabacteria bacterium GWF2_37_15]